MEIVWEVFRGEWLFDFIADHPVLLAVIVYGLLMIVVSAILIGRSEGGILRWLGREIRDLWNESGSA